MITNWNEISSQYETTDESGSTGRATIIYNDSVESAPLVGLGHVLTVEDLESLLQRLNLVLAAGHALLVRHTGVNAGRLQLVEILEGSVELLLGGLKILLPVGEVVLLVDVLVLLVLNVLGLGGLVNGGLSLLGISNGLLVLLGLSVADLSGLCHCLVE